MYYTFAMKLWRFLIITGLFCRWRYKYRIVALYRTITCIAFLLHFISFYGFNFYSILSPYIPFHFLCFFSIHFLSFDFISRHLLTSYAFIHLFIYHFIHGVEIWEQVQLNFFYIRKKILMSFSLSINVVKKFEVTENVG